MEIKYDVLNKNGEKVKDYNLSENIFGVEYHQQVVFDAIMVARANERQATAKTKKRSEVRGGGKKPFRQKGTGRARQGSSRAPQMVGGGNVFGPTGNQNFKIKQNRKEARLALKSVLSEKVSEKDLIIVDAFDLETPKTKEFASILKNVNAKDKVLLVVDEDRATILSARNIENLKVVSPRGINVYDIVKHHSLIVSEKALTTIEEVFQ
mgnify:CR=1 FL=1